MSQPDAAVVAQINEVEAEILEIDARLSNTTKAGLIVGSITMADTPASIRLLTTLIGLLVQCGLSKNPDQHTDEQKELSSLAVKFGLFPRGVDKNVLGLRFLDAFSSYEAGRNAATAAEGCCDGSRAASHDGEVTQINGVDGCGG